MSDLASIVELVRYSETANDLMMSCVLPLTDTQLDKPLDLGMGSLRKICQHLLAGEVTWLARISGQVEAKWPARPIPESAAEMHALFGQVARVRYHVDRTTPSPDLLPPAPAQESFGPWLYLADDLAQVEGVANAHAPVAAFVALAGHLNIAAGLDVGVEDGEGLVAGRPRPEVHAPEGELREPHPGPAQLQLGPHRHVLASAAPSSLRAALPPRRGRGSCAVYTSILCRTSFRFSVSSATRAST